MKKIDFNPKKWKLKKRHSFGYYFVLLTMLLTFVTSTISTLMTELINRFLEDSIKIPDFVYIIVISLIVGLVLSIFISKVLLGPIKNLQNMMEEVSRGDLSIRSPETSNFDEIEDIYHYFNQMMDELQATEIIQSDFISNVSHEFKTPLNAIDGYATLLEDGNLTAEEKEEYLEKIHFNTKRMNELIGNILLLAKLDNQNIELKKITYSLDEQIRQSIVYLEPKWEAKKINFDVDLEEVNYFGNENIMMHVWNNLIDNAIKFSPDNGIIRIKLKKEKNRIIYIIEDDGPGISEDTKEYIFNKFYQADTSHKVEGNGLGLSLVKKILDLSDSTVETENLYPTGCRFIVHLN